MSRDYPHLHDSVRALVTESDESRIRRIRADRWVGYARADAALSAFEELLTFPKRTRMPNLLLCGPTNNGKSMVLEKFRRVHPAVPSGVTPEGVARVPVLKIQMPPGPDERRFFGSILDALAVPRLASESISRRQDAAMELMQSTGVSLLIIDEAQNLLAGAQLQQRRMLNLLRWLGNELQIPIIAAGTAEALHAVQSDDQLANRFEPIALPRWGYGEEYRELLRTLEALLPLRRPSHLAKPVLAHKILAAAEGILGEVVAILTRAAVRAVTTGTEAITVEMIAGCGSSRPRSVVVLPFETFDDPDSDSPALRQLPLYVEPEDNEVLLSWLLRLATRLGVSLQTLVRAAFWIDDRGARSQWWRRPEPQMLSRIGAKTGINIERLRGMTLESWSPVYRDDEANERFSAERFRAEAPRRQGFAMYYANSAWRGTQHLICERHGQLAG